MKKIPYFKLQEQNTNQVFCEDIFKSFSSFTQLKRIPNAAAGIGK